MDKVISYTELDADCTSNIDPPTFPDGLDVEVFGGVCSKMNLGRNQILKESMLPRLYETGISKTELKKCP